MLLLFHYLYSKFDDLFRIWIWLSGVRELGAVTEAYKLTMHSINDNKNSTVHRTFYALHFMMCKNHYHNVIFL